MSVSNTEIFGPTLEKANLWLKELMMELDLIDRHKAYLALKAVLQTLRDRLTVEEVAQLGAQLPMLIRGLYYEGWDPSGKPVKERHQEEFLAHVKSHFKGDERFFAERMTRAVFKVLSKRISEGEIEDIKHVLPKELRDLWP
jgi:uncharacterized protein (DUF2267 family)